MKSTKRTLCEVVCGLQCLVDPDPTGGRCYECGYDCSADPEKVRERIEKDALAMLQHFGMQGSGAH